MQTTFLTANTVDDLLRKVVTAVLDHGHSINPTKGSAKELLAVLLELTEPRARLSRTETRGKIFSCLGELLWYLSGSDSVDFIGHYIPHYRDAAVDGRILDAYGPRLFRFRDVNQVEAVIETLRTKRDSRNAVIQLFDASDLLSRGDKPCTCTLQFFLRTGVLHMVVTMRSNDIYLGLVHDIFCFTMFQEIVARTVGAELGTYRHMVGSLHLYDRNQDDLRAFLAEGYQERTAMPEMPPGDPWPSIATVLAAEREIRDAQQPLPLIEGLHPYWGDLVRLLAIFSLRKTAGTEESCIELANGLVNDHYRLYATARRG